MNLCRCITCDYAEDSWPTFKMITAAAGLEEGVITTDSYITDLIEFDKVQPSASCWSTQVSHGSIEVRSAIKESCNYFFYEVGFRLGLDSNGYYNSEYGISASPKIYGFIWLRESDIGALN